MLSPPNLLDYLNFLYQVVGISQTNLPSVIGTATDGGPNFLTDANANWDPGQWNGYYCQDLTSNQTGLIIDTNPATGTITFRAPFDPPVVSNDSYAIITQPVLMSLDRAQGTVNDSLSLAAPSMYTGAVYNLATHFMITYCPDQPGQTWWQQKREFFRLTDPILGIVQSTGNDVSNTTYLNPEQFKSLTLGDLQLMKTPYGREYLADAQAYGFEPWGMT